MNSFSSRGIPRKLIVCSAHIWHKLAECDRYDKCKKLICCWHCSRQGHCNMGGGCGKGTLIDYPKKCDTYPITWEKAKTAYALYRLMASNKLHGDPNDYIGFSKFLVAFIGGNRNTKANKKAK